MRFFSVKNRKSGESVLFADNTDHGIMGDISCFPETAQLDKTTVNQCVDIKSKTGDAKLGMNR